MDLDHLRAELARRILVRAGVIPDYGPVDPNQPVKTVTLNFKCGQPDQCRR